MCFCPIYQSTFKIYMWYAYIFTHIHYLMVLFERKICSAWNMCRNSIEGTTFFCSKYCIIWNAYACKIIIMIKLKIFFSLGKEKNIIELSDIFKKRKERNFFFYFLVAFYYLLACRAYQELTWALDSVFFSQNVFANRYPFPRISAIKKIHILNICILSRNRCFSPFSIFARVATRHQIMWWWFRCEEENIYQAWTNI